MTPAKSSPQTVQARLQAVINQSRQIMRKDAGLNGELDRLPQLAWLLFLKAFDDLEEEREAMEDGYRAVLPDRLRWRAWAAGSDLTGEPFLTFVNDDLLVTLRGLRGSGKPGDPRDTLARVFQDTTNRMLSGHLLRQLVDQVNKVEFSHRDEMHAMAVFYETMLREMRDAAGDSGEFYTPRPLIRFIVDQVDPRPGETVLDPAAGTGGFLIEAYKHMTAGKISANDVERVKSGLRGIEKKPMPHLLGQMNLLLHGIDRPSFVEQNSLNLPLADVRRAGVDVVLTNPPFGGEEEKLVQANFPAQFRTAETAWLFLQSVMARIERSRNGRCAIVVPNSVLFDTGVGGKIKADLMRRFNLHTVLRLPYGVFAPYTIIPSNVLFFEKGAQGPVWFYEIVAPDGRKNYTKTKPMRDEEFADCGNWWGGRSRNGRVENERAWRVDAESIKKAGYNLDLHNPHRPDDLEHRSPKDLVAELIETERQLLKLYEELQRQRPLRSTKAEWAALGDVLSLDQNPVEVAVDGRYRSAGVLNRGRGIFDKGVLSGSDTSYSRLYRLSEGQIVYSKLIGWEGAVALVPSQFDGYYVSSEFPTFAPDTDRILPKFLENYLKSKHFTEQMARSTNGLGQRRQRVNVGAFLRIAVPIPSIAAQDHIVSRFELTDASKAVSDRTGNLAAALLPAARNEIFSAMR